MIYTRPDGSTSLLPDSNTIIAESGLIKMAEAIKIIEEHYEHLNTTQHGKLRAMAGHLMAMVEDE